MVPYEELRVKIVDNEDDVFFGTAIKIADGEVWVKFDDSGDIVECPMDRVEIVYPEMEAASA